MKTLMAAIGLTGLVALGGCATTDMAADASSHCEANISTRVRASDCAAEARTRSGLPYYKYQQRNTGVDASLRR
jgi:hypothetical protein